MTVIWYQIRSGMVLADSVKHVVLLFRQLVEFALPFGGQIGGVGVTNSWRPSGVGVTFFFAGKTGDWLGNNDSHRFDRYAKGMFTNLIETKAGLSPDCLKENLKGIRNRKTDPLAIANFATRKIWGRWIPLNIGNGASNVPA
jgi:hypothetical protein